MVTTARDLVPVDITVTERPGAVVEVVGDLPDWRTPLRMTEATPGCFALRLLLAPGLYRYKLVVDGAWRLDPGARVIDRTEGVDNNVLIVDGTAPPVHFANDRRHVGFLQDGQGTSLLVVAEIDDGEPLPRVWLSRASGARAGEIDELVLHPRLRRGGRVFLEGRAPVAEPTTPVRFGFTGHPAHVFTAGPTPPAVDRAPSWLHGATFYGIFLDRWRRGTSSTAEPRILSARTPSTPFVFYGGDLDGVRESLPYVAALGVTAVVLTPIQHADSPHRYDGRDLLVVDPRLGGERALAALVTACHAAGLKLVVDVSLTHVSERHAAFQDVLEKQERSAFCSWFRIKRFPVRKRDASTFEHYYNCADLPWLDLGDGSPARAHAIEAAVRLAQHGVDGLRLDAMQDAPPSFWRELRAAVRKQNPELLFLGEVVTDVLAPWAEAGGADVVTDFRIRDAFLAFFATQNADARALFDALVFAAHRTGAFGPEFRLGFVDNHDTARFLSLCRGPGDPVRRLEQALALLLFCEQPAWLHYGTEAHLAAHRGESPLDAAWPERLPMPPLSSVPARTRDLIQSACAVRRAMVADGAGPIDVREATGARLTVERRGRTRTFTLELDRDTGMLRSHAD